MDDDKLFAVMSRHEREINNLRSNLTAELEKLNFRISGLEVKVHEFEIEAIFTRAGTLLAFIFLGERLWRSLFG